MRINTQQTLRFYNKHNINIKTTSNGEIEIDLLGTIKNIANLLTNETEITTNNHFDNSDTITNFVTIMEILPTINVKKIKNNDETFIITEIANLILKSMFHHNDKNIFTKSKTDSSKEQLRALLFANIALIKPPTISKSYLIDFSTTQKNLAQALLPINNWEIKEQFLLLYNCFTTIKNINNDNYQEVHSLIKEKITTSLNEKTIHMEPFLKETDNKKICALLTKRTNLQAQLSSPTITSFDDLSGENIPDKNSPEITNQNLPKPRTSSKTAFSNETAAIINHGNNSDNPCIDEDNDFDDLSSENIPDKNSPEITNQNLPKPRTSSKIKDFTKKMRLSF